MDISVILNSRGRTSLLMQFLFQLNYLADHSKSFEILVGCDNDDKTTKFFEDTLNHFPNTKTIFQDRNINLLKRYNEMTFASTGKYIFVLNDDAFVLTNNWNNIIYDTLEEYLKDKSDGIVLGMTQDDSCDKCGQYSSFPVISRKGTKTLGFFMLDDWHGFLGGDVLIHRIYDNINRITNIPVQISHIFHNTVQKVVNPDETAREMRNWSGTHMYDCQTYNIDKYANLLIDKINE